MNTTTQFVYDMCRKNKRELTLIIVVASVGALFAVIIPYVYGRLFDLAIVSSTPPNVLLSLVGVWLVLSLISTYISNRTGFMGEVLGTKMSLEAEADAYSHFLTLPILFHKKEQRGEVLHKISRGSWRLQDLISTVADILPQWLMLLFSIMIMLFIKWQLAVIVVFSFLVYGFFTIKLVKPEIKAKKKENQAFEKQ